MDTFDVSQATAYRHIERFSRVHGRMPLQTDKPAWLAPYQQINSLLQRAIARDDERENRSLFDAPKHLDSTSQNLCTP